MALTKATTNVVNLDKDTVINALTVGRGGGNQLGKAAVGYETLQNNTTGSNCAAFGNAALKANTTGSFNTGCGAGALEQNTTGDNNTATGLRSLYSNTTGYGNSAAGVGALYNNTTGIFNVAVGVDCLNANTTGDQNTATGAGALKSNTTGTNNVALGVNALRNATSNYNTAVGTAALESTTTGSDNTAIGITSLRFNTTGSYNTGLGRNTLFVNQVGNFNTAIGDQAMSATDGYDNCSAIGYAASVSGSNQVQIGNSVTTTYAYGAVQDRSDIRDKADVRDTELGLEFVNALRPVDFKWDMREDYRPEAPKSVDKPAELKEDASDEEKAKYEEELAAYNAYKVELDKWLEDVKLANITHDGSKKRNRFHHGLIAQEVKAVLDAKGIDFGGFQDHSVKGGDDVLSIGYEELIAPMLKAIQELSAEVAALKSK